MTQPTSYQPNAKCDWGNQRVDAEPCLREAMPKAWLCAEHEAEKQRYTHSLKKGPSLRVKQLKLRVEHGA